MSAKAIREYTARQLLTKFLPEESHDRQITLDPRLILVDPTTTDLDNLPRSHPWLLTTRLVVKPDQLLKRRGKMGLVGLDLSWDQTRRWIEERRNRTISVGAASGVLDHFLICPFVDHEAEEEYYLCIRSKREGDEILFQTHGGVGVGDVDANARRMVVDIDDRMAEEGDRDTIGRIQEELLHAGGDGMPVKHCHALASFILALMSVYRRLHFTYLEINPLVMTRKDSLIHVLDLAGKLDETASFLCRSDWGHVEFPSPFGQTRCAEENYIRELDSRTGASLKLTVLNPQGRIWTLVAGGGASVVYADTICDLGFGDELANYGEYSGNPSAEDTYEYASTVIGLMTKQRDPRGKVLIIGGGIANFTDVASTFAGVIKALRAYKEELIAHNVQIWIRRAGPNWQEGLRLMRDCAVETNLPMKIFGPDTDMTAVVPMALGVDIGSDYREFDSEDPTEESEAGKVVRSEHVERTSRRCTLIPPFEDRATNRSVENFSASTRCIIYGLQIRAAQGMLDFDRLCKREKPSVAAMVYPFKPSHFSPFYFGQDEIMIPVYQNMDEAINKHQDVSVVVDFASCRSVYSTVTDLLQYSNQIKTIVIIAEGVPEQQTRYLGKIGRNRGVTIIGPATVGGLKPGCLRVGNAGGMLDNIIASKLYRPGHVAYVTKSGGISNELNSIICRNSDGVYEGVAIGGDRYPCTTLVDHLLRYQNNPDVKILVALGEVGGRDEYEIISALEDGRITKPLICWCIGTCSVAFPYSVQFGHAGAMASQQKETALAKNEALREAGAHVPANFGELGSVLQRIYNEMTITGDLVPVPEPRIPKVPMDYAWAKTLGMIRKPKQFVSSICDERGNELMYCGVPISSVFSENMGLADVISLLWLRRILPAYASKFLEIALIVIADHGPAVSGAHNTIVATRAGKDLVSSLASGLLTIGPRFGGALDEAAITFANASDAGISAESFVKQMRKDNRLIMGIGYKVKSLTNPDKRVEIIKDYALKHFPDNTVLIYALEVEKITTRKKSNLILNVDGMIAVCMVDMLRSCGAFTKVEVDELIQDGLLNGLFVLGRSIGFIGHHLDQKRLKQGLWRCPWDDIYYLHDDDDSSLPPGGDGGSEPRQGMSHEEQKKENE